MAGTIHHALGLLQQRCPGLLTLSLTDSTSVNPELFIPVFRHFPHLTKINLRMACKLFQTAKFEFFFFALRLMSPHHGVII